MLRRSRAGPDAHPIPRGTPRDPAKQEETMDDTEHNGNGDEFDEQFEQMLIENGVLVHALAALLVRKGLLKQEEIDAEMDRLYEEMEKFEQQ
jgi:hypothetical protein